MKMKINTIEEALKEITFPITGEFKSVFTPISSEYAILTDETLFGNRKYYNGTINSWEHLYDIFELDKDRLCMDIDRYNRTNRNYISIDIGTADIMFCYFNYEGNQHPTIRPTKTLVFPKIDGRKPVFINLLEDVKSASDIPPNPLKPSFLGDCDEDCDVVWV